MKLIVTTHTFLKKLPVQVGQIKSTEVPHQLVLLRKGTELEIADICLSQSSVSEEANHYLVRLTQSLVEQQTCQQNLYWFVEHTHVRIVNGKSEDSYNPRNSYEAGATETCQTPLFANPFDSLDSLVASPPVKVQGRCYPFGRIVLGGNPRADDSQWAEQWMPELHRLLHAQKIQAPFRLRTDWLSIGRVDEIVSFIPADNSKGFQVLVASPLSAHIILKRIANRGFADAVMFKGMKRADYSGPPGTLKSAEIKIGELLQDTAFWEANRCYQRYLFYNIQILQQALDLGGSHFVSIPALFHAPFESSRATAYFPNLTNFRLLKDEIVVSKPEGPKINGKCAFETAFEHAFPERKARFVKCESSFHEELGETSHEVCSKEPPSSDEY